MYAFSQPGSVSARPGHYTREQVHVKTQDLAVLLQGPLSMPCVHKPLLVCLLTLSASVMFAVLQNDFTPEQEEEVRRENQWAFD